MRQFEDKLAKRERVPILLGIAGYAGSGKTYSALRIATGMQKVIGGEVFGIDTEGKRMLQLAGIFNFRHVAMDAPFGSLDYLSALEHCKAKGASIVIVDSMTHEHSSIGGYLDLSDKWLSKRYGDDDNAWHKNYARSFNECGASRE